MREKREHGRKWSRLYRSKRHEEEKKEIKRNRESGESEGRGGDKQKGNERKQMSKCWESETCLAERAEERGNQHRRK